MRGSLVPMRMMAHVALTACSTSSRVSCGSLCLASIHTVSATSCALEAWIVVHIRTPLGMSIWRTNIALSLVISPNTTMSGPDRTAICHASAESGASPWVLALLLRRAVSCNRVLSDVDQVHSGTLSLEEFDAPHAGTLGAGKGDGVEAANAGAAIARVSTAQEESTARDNPERADLRRTPALQAGPMRERLDAIKAERAQVRGELTGLAKDTDPSRVAGPARIGTEHNRRLEHLLRELRRAMFGKKSEKLHPDQLQLAFEALEGALAEAEEQAAASTTPAPRAKRPDARRNIGYLPEHLPRIEQVIEPESTLCPCGCGEMVKIGEDRTERLHIVPAQLQVIVTVRPKYACRKCEEGVTQAPAPAHLIESGLPTEGMLAHVMVSKFADHLPLYRQAQIYARSGIDLHRSTLALWVGKGSFELRPVYECLKGELKTSDNLALDETTVRVLDPGRGKTKTGYMWTMARDERGWSGPDPPGVVYEYAPGRRSSSPGRLLARGPHQNRTRRFPPSYVVDNIRWCMWRT